MTPWYVWVALGGSVAANAYSSWTWRQIRKGPPRTGPRPLTDKTKGAVTTLCPHCREQPHSPNCLMVKNGVRWADIRGTFPAGIDYEKWGRHDQR